MRPAGSASLACGGSRVGGRPCPSLPCALSAFSAGGLAGMLVEHIIQLIEGKASAYVFASPGCKKWDTCAPEVILHAVGGKLTDIHGNALQYNKEVKHMNSAGVLATLRNYDYYASRVPESVKSALVP
ncbi:3'(2'),5'-bisphosphate nucleotidase 1-like [Manis pentadactyla]|uniref:3'(2'),5'-bisphosphate nucleotidase 1-like n=1 Tax=Manis pentadactyla TaxID=143292 RepID=UPI00255D0882|nr:3'(2'),5'-bisphosphate nucleotidase 1-like [Manis pentadactyla]